MGVRMTGGERGPGDGKLSGVGPERGAAVGGDGTTAGRVNPRCRWAGRPSGAGSAMLLQLCTWQVVRNSLRRTAVYIDPGSGSFAIQILIATLLGSLLTVRFWWGRVIGLLQGWRSRAQRTTGDEPTDSCSQTPPSDREPDGTKRT